MNQILSRYGRAKVEATLKILEHAWSEALEKESLKPGTEVANDNPREVQILDRHLVSWLKRERLNHEDLSNVLDRLKSENVILAHGYAMLDDEEVNPYFSHSYHSVTMPSDFDERSTKYLASFNEPNSIPQTGQKLVRRSRAPRDVSSSHGVDVAVSIVTVPIRFILKILGWIWFLVWKFVRDIATYAYGHTVKIIGAAIALAALGYLVSIFF